MSVPLSSRLRGETTKLVYYVLPVMVNMVCCHHGPIPRLLFQRYKWNQRTDNVLSPVASLEVAAQGHVGDTTISTAGVLLVNGTKL